MILEKELGGYSHSMITMRGSFQCGAVPSVYRDGTNATNANKIFSVAQISAGLYEVTFVTGFPIPALPFIILTLAQGATPTTPCKVSEVNGSWNATTRKFRILMQTVGTTPAASNGDAGDRISFLVAGSINGVGTDPA